MKCHYGLKMSSKGFVRAGSIFWGISPLPGANTELWKMKQNLEKTLGRLLDMPCYDGSVTETDNGEVTIYCEVCEVTDTNRVVCPKSSQVSNNDYYELCRDEKDFDPTSCKKARCSNIEGSVSNYVYHQNYDDGSICDCGAPFILTWTRDNGNSVFRPATQNDAMTAMMITGPHTVSSIYTAPGGGFGSRAWWELGSELLVSQPSVPGPSTCSSRPDISSIVQDKVDTSIPLGAGTDFY